LIAYWFLPHQPATVNKSRRHSFSICMLFFAGANAATRLLIASISNGHSV
jgi:hypothetical protein